MGGYHAQIESHLFIPLMSSRNTFRFTRDSDEVKLVLAFKWVSLTIKFQRHSYRTDEETLIDKLIFKSED